MQENGISGGSVAKVLAADGTTVVAGAPLTPLSNPSLELDVAIRSAGIIGQISADSGAKLSVQQSRQDGARDIAERLPFILLLALRQAKRPGSSPLSSRPVA